MDFLSDQRFDGRRIRVLSIVDNFTRLSPELDVRHSSKGSDVVSTLERVAAQYGRPQRIRVGSGPGPYRRTLICGPISMTQCWTSVALATKP